MTTEAREIITRQWTQAICGPCWDVRNPGKIASRAREPKREQCCDCGQPTMHGIYFRTDPYTVKYPRVVITYIGIDT